MTLKNTCKCVFAPRAREAKTPWAPSHIAMAKTGPILGSGPSDGKRFFRVLKMDIEFTSNM